MRKKKLSNVFYDFKDAGLDLGQNTDNNGWMESDFLFEELDPRD